MTTSGWLGIAVLGAALGGIACTQRDAKPSEQAAALECRPKAPARAEPVRNDLHDAPASGETEGGEEALPPGRQDPDRFYRKAPRKPHHPKNVYA